MTILKTVFSNQSKSFYNQGLITSTSLCIGTIIYGMIIDLPLNIIFERMFFQTFSIMFFCFTLNQSYKIYDKQEKTEIENKKEEKSKFNL